jgi:hypothetical protein
MMKRASPSDAARSNSIYSLRTTSSNPGKAMEDKAIKGKSHLPNLAFWEDAEIRDVMLIRQPN